MKQDHNGYSLASTTVILGVISLAVYLYWSTRRQRGLPPGPPVVPLLGCLSYLRMSNLPQKLTKAREIYGDLLTIRLFGQDIVVLNSYEVIKDALVNHSNVFSGRPSIPPSNKGLILANGKLWQEQRKFAHGVLRDFGVGRSKLEEMILKELDLVLGVLQAHAQAGPVNLSGLFINAVSNIICSISFGKHFQHEDPEFQTLMKYLKRFFTNAAFSHRVGSIPFLKYLPGDVFGINARVEVIKHITDIFKKEVDSHQSVRISGQHRDYIDAFLEQMEKSKHDEESTFSEEQLLLSLFALFTAGSETTSTTLRWAVLFLLHNPEMQTKIQKEIQDNLENHPPSMKDKTNLPLTEAFILECQRLGDIAPLSVPHVTTEDVHFRGYHIPKDTRVLINLHGVHHDSELWKDPFKFDPSRFLGSDGKVEKNEHLIPFSMGKRVCLGESMARMELFLFFTGIMQHFSFKSPPGQELPSLEGISSVIHEPPGYEVLVVPKDKM